MNKLENKSYTLEEILDSDDELPIEYVEIPFVPAYQNNNRFEFIEEQKNAKIVKGTEKKLNSTGEVKHVKPLHYKSNTIMTGYLNKKDKFCFQCLEPKTSKKTRLWFFNFLLFKDLQSVNKSHTTCLVPNYYKEYVVFTKSTIK